MKKLILTIIILLFALPCWATNHYVDSSCGVNGDGTTQTCGATGPWNSLASLNAELDGGGDAVQPADTVYFKRGLTYAGFLDIDTSGTAGNIITFSAYGTGADPIIDATGNDHAVDLREQDYLTFEYLDVRNGTAEIFFMRGFVDESTNITIDNCSIDTSADGIDIRGTAPTAIIVSNTTISNCTYAFRFTSSTIGTVTIDTVTATSGNGYGLYSDLTSTIETLTITNSEFSNMTNDGFRIGCDVGTLLDIDDSIFNSNGGNGLIIAASIAAADIDNLTCNLNGTYGLVISPTTGDTATNITIDDSVFNSNAVGDIYNGVYFSETLTGSGGTATLTGCTFSLNGNDGAGIADDWTSVIFDRCTIETNGTDGVGADGDGISFHNASAGTIKNCSFKDNWKTGMAHIDTSQVSMWGNTIIHSGTQAGIVITGGTHLIYNNTLYSSAQVVDGINASGGTVTATNNIIYGFEDSIDDDGAAAFTISYNCGYGYGGDPWEGFGGGGAGALIVDPKLVDAANDDFHLLVSSPCIDAGTPIPTIVKTDIDGQPTTDPHVDGSADIGADRVMFKLDLTGGTTSNYVLLDGEDDNYAGLAVAGDNTLDNYTIARCKSGAMRINASDTMENMAFDDETYAVSGVTLTANSCAFQQSKANAQGDGTITDTDCQFSVSDFGFRDKSSGDFNLIAGSVLRDAGKDTGAATDLNGKSTPRGAAHDIGAYEFIVLLGLHRELKSDLIQDLIQDLVGN